eukprot:1460078-Rhodomonas_salina.1
MPLLLTSREAFPGQCGGARQMIELVVKNDAARMSYRPNRQDNPLAAVNPEPYTVTGTPPAEGTIEGEARRALGVSWKINGRLSIVLKFASTFKISIPTCPGKPFGVLQVRTVVESAVAFVGMKGPTWHTQEEDKLKPYPRMVKSVPPLTGPVLGFTCVAAKAST